MENKNNKYIIIVIIALLIFFIDVISNYYFGDFFNQSLYIQIIVLISIIIVTLLFINTINKNPTSLIITILGFPRSGKTVYLTVLYNELSTYSYDCNKKVDKIVFSSYGNETNEIISNDINNLYKGIWPLPTPENTVFYYRANAALISSSFFKKRFKITIPDFAGQKIKEFDPTDNKWLHKSSYFKEVCQSEAIMFAIDMELVANEEMDKITETQNAFITALNLIFENKGVTVGKKMKAPICILYLKSDLIINKQNDYLKKLEKLYREKNNVNKEIYNVEKNGIHSVGSLISKRIKINKDIENYQKKLDYFSDENMSKHFSKLFSALKKNCLKYNEFYISSVGGIDSLEKPIMKQDSLNICEPLIWILKSTWQI